MPQWFVVRHGQEQGPFDDAQLKKLAADGNLGPDDLVRRNDSPTGTPAKNIKGLFTPSAASSSGVLKRPPPPPARIETASPLPLPEWHYAQNNVQFGPVTFSQLRDLATTGRLRSTDLVWKVGTPNWREACTIDDLFAAAIADQYPSATTGSPQATVQVAASGAAPPLWNPSVIRVLGFFLTWGVGAFLLARNWKALGEMERAQRSMIWCYSIFAWFLLAIVSPNVEAAGNLFRLAWLVIFICWAYFDAQPQINYVKERFGDDYPRKGWLGLATTSKASNWKKLLAGCFLFAVVFVVIVAVSEDGPSPAVRHAPEPASVPLQSVPNREFFAASSIAKDYLSNEIAADSKYKGKIILVSGTVDNVGKGWSGTTVRLETVAPYISADLACVLSKASEAGAATLHRGDHVKVRGYFKGKSGLFQLTLSDCEFILD